MQALTSDPKIKCVIWDLDDTLWDGSLAENQNIRLRTNVIELIERLDQKGIVNSICSKNSYPAAKEVLERLGIWDYFVFPVIDFVPKGQNVKQIIANLQLRSANVLFVDDGIGNRSEVEYYCDGITVLDPREPHFVSTLNELIEHTEGASRLDQYKTLEHKSADRVNYADNEGFLQASNITACVLRNPADLAFRERIFELANRSNQLNFTKSRFSSPQELTDYLTNQQSMEINHGVVFVYDKYGDYGLVGFYAFNENTRSPRLDHFYFSCRILNMGVEQAVYAVLHKEWNVRQLTPFDFPRDNTRHHVHIIREPDDRVRRYIAAQSSTPASYKTSIIAGCTSGIIDHYLGESMRPARFDPSVLAIYGKVLPTTDSIIYTIYSDYINTQWAKSGGFSYDRFARHLTEFLRKHAERHTYLILASERKSHSPKVRPQITLRHRLGVATRSLLGGQNRSRIMRCNRLVRELAAGHSNVTIIEIGDFIRSADEQHNGRHFDRIVMKRICDYIAGLRNEDKPTPVPPLLQSVTEGAGSQEAMLRP